MSGVYRDCRWFVGLEACAGKLEVCKEEFCAPWVGKELFGAYHAVLHGVVEIPDLQTGRFKSGTSVDEVVPGAVLVSAFAGVRFFRKVFPESAGIV